MSSATLSSKFQILVPKDVREAMRWRAGQKFDFIRVGNLVHVVPQRRIQDLFGVAKHVTEPFERDRSDLDNDPEMKAAIEAKLRRVAKKEASASVRNRAKAIT